jgi:hypothetical protein
MTKQKSAMVKPGEYGVGNANAPMAGHLFLDMPSCVALGIVKMQKQSATCDVSPLLGVSSGQRNSHFAEKLCGCGQGVLWV